MEALRKINTEIETEIHLRVVRGGLCPPSKKDARISHFWTFCHSTFWSTENFSVEEVEKFKALIAEHFKDGEKVNYKFKQLVERATLAKRYVKRKWWRFITKPMNWLDIDFKFGLAGTESWYKDVLFQRMFQPDHNEGIKLLAKAVLDYSKDQNPYEVEYYRNEFIKLRQNDLLFLYTNFIMHMEFIND